MQHNKKTYAGNHLSKTTKQIYDYTHIGKMPFRLFFSCLTVREKVTAIWLVITGKLSISKGLILPSPSSELTLSSDVFLERLCRRITDDRHFEIDDYGLLTDLIAELAHQDMGYVSVLYDLLHYIHGDRSSKITNLYLWLHSCEEDDKYLPEVNIAMAWREYHHNGQAISAYKRAYESTSNPERKAFCLQAIEHIKRSMYIIY